MKQRMKILAGVVAGGVLLTGTVRATINDCISGWTTNCVFSASNSLSYYWDPYEPPVTGNGFLICPSSAPGLVVTVATHQGGVETTDTNCSLPGIGWSVDPIIVTQWWSLTFTNGTTTNGLGLEFPGSMSTNSGPATLTFYLTYTNPPPCTDSDTVSLPVSLDIMGAPQTNDLICWEPPATNLLGKLDPASLMFCLGETMPARSTTSAGPLTGRVWQQVYGCPGPAFTFVTNNVLYDVKSNYFEPPLPATATTAGDWPYVLKLVCEKQTSNAPSNSCPATVIVDGGSITYKVIEDSGSDSTCHGPTVAGLDTNPVSTNICVGTSIAPLSVGGVPVDGEIETTTRDCIANTTTTTTAPAGYIFDPPRYEPGWPGVFNSVGNHEFKVLVDGYSPSCGSTVLEIGSFTVIVTEDKTTNKVCLPGSLVDAGTLSFTNAAICEGSPISFPTYEGGAFSLGTNRTEIRSCNPTNGTNQDIDSTFSYSVSSHWSPELPAIPETGATYVFTRMVVGSPGGNGPCRAITNEGPSFSVSVIKVDLDTGVPEEEEDTAGDATRPGKIIMVNSGDADHDGLRNYADFAAVDGTSGFGIEEPVTLKIPQVEGRENFRVKFAYPESDPAGVTVNNNTPTLPAGKFRLWRTHGAAVRSAQPVPTGDYLKPGQAYSLEELGFTDPTVTEVVFYAEAVAVSDGPADIRLQSEIDPDGDGPLPYAEPDAVRFTALDVGLMEASGESSTTARDKFKDSDSSPVITVTQCAVANVRASGDGSAILADLTVSGTVTAAVCDITPGDQGVISNVFIHVNSFETPLDATGVPMTVSKGTNLASFTKPYPYSGTFTKTYTGVEVDSGTNLVRLTASDEVVGNTGFVELTFEVTATDLAAPWVDYDLLSYANVNATLDFGGIHSLAQLTPGHGVSLSLGAMVSTNPTFASTLYRTSAAGQSPVVLASQGTNNIAWAIIPDAGQLAAALDTNTAETVTVAIYAPALLPAGVLFDLGETTTNSSAFGHDRIAVTMTLSGAPTTNAVNQMSVTLSRSGFGDETATLTETETNSLVFTNGSISLQLADADFASTNYDAASVTVTCPALELTGHAANTVETGTNTLAFVTFEPFEFYTSSSSSSGWNFGWDFDVGACTEIARSEGGELHLHYLQFQGPTAVLAYLATRPGSTIIQGTDGQYYFKRPGEERPADYAGVAGGDGAWFGLSDGSGAFLLGFTKGFVSGGFSMVKGTANAIVAVEEWYLNIRFGIDEQQVAAYNQWANFTRETSETIKTLASFAQQVADDSVAYIVHAEHGQLEEVNEISARYQAVTEYTVELVQELADEYLNETDFRKGEIFGKAMFAAVTMVAPYVKAGQAAQAGKLAFLTSLRNASFFQNNTRALAALDRAIARLQTILAKRQPGRLDSHVLNPIVDVPTPWEKFLQSAFTDLTSASADIGHFATRQLMDGFDEVAQSGNLFDAAVRMKVPTFAEAESVFRQFKGLKGEMDRPRKVKGQWDTRSTYPGSELENHHAVFAHLMDKMEEAGLLKAGVNRDMSPSLLTSWAKHRGVDAKNIHATIDPMVKEMFEKIKRGELEFNVETVKQTLAKGYRDCELPSVAKTVELFLDEVKTP